MRSATSSSTRSPIASSPALPFGTQKRVELARALMAKPKLLLMDEPAGGLNHDEVHELGRLVKQIRDDRHMTVLIVEHHMGLVMSISDNVVALNFGKKIAEGRACRRAEGPRPHQGLSRRGGRVTHRFSTSAKLEGFYGQIRALHGLDFKIEDRGRSRHCSAPTAPARQRRSARCAAWIAATGDDHLRWPAAARPIDRGHRAAWESRMCPRGAAPSRGMTCRREPAARRNQPSRTAPADRAGHRAVLCLFPAPQAASQAASRHAVGRASSRCSRSAAR